MAPKLTKNSAAVKLLKSKFRSGKITSSHTPAEVWKSESVFQQYKLPTFRTRFHKIKKEIQGEDEDNIDKEEDDDLNRRCTVDNTKKRRLIEEAVEYNDEGNESFIESVGAGTFVQDQHSFKPLYLLSDWEEPQTRTARVSVAIALPSGINSGDFSVCVAEGGTKVELRVRWPTALVNVEMLHRKWLCADDESQKIEKYHPKICGFEKALMKLRKMASDCVESIALIPLPFAVETHIAGKSNLACRESTVKVIYLDMKASITSYAVCKNDDSFRVV